jgi:hypothetical protein
MKKAKRELTTRLSLTYIELLDKLSLKDEDKKNAMIAEALSDYFKKKGIVLEEEPEKEPEQVEETSNIIEEEIVPEPVSDTSQESSVQETSEETQEGEPAENKKAILLMIPVLGGLWEYSDKADIIIGKRKVREVYEFKGFLGFQENNLKEYDQFQEKIEELKKEGRIANISKSQKDKITINYSDVRKYYEKYKNFHIAIIIGKDKTLSFIKTSYLKTLILQEEIYKNKEIELTGGNTIIMVKHKGELLDIFNIYNSLLRKLELVSKKIIEGYKPIDRKWKELEFERGRDLRTLNMILQIIFGILSFIVVTIVFINQPTLFLIPLVTEIKPLWRYFIGAYVFTFPVLIILVNYIIIYMFWYQTRLIFIKKTVKKFIEKDIKNLKDKVGFEVFR